MLFSLLEYPSDNRQLCEIAFTVSEINLIADVEYPSHKRCRQKSGNDQSRDGPGLIVGCRIDVTPSTRVVLVTLAHAFVASSVIAAIRRTMRRFPFRAIFQKPPRVTKAGSTHTVAVTVALGGAWWLLNFIACLADISLVTQTLARVAIASTVVVAGIRTKKLIAVGACVVLIAAT